jgi:hypothetical protein
MIAIQQINKVYIQHFMNYGIENITSLLKCILYYADWVVIQK